MAGARQLAWPSLIWSHFSRSRFDDIDGRIAAAGAAGFAGIGLYLQAWQREADAGRSIADLGDALDRHGVVLAEVETLRGWWRDDPEVTALEHVAYDLADALDVRYLQAIGPYDCPTEQAIERFAGLCDRAAEHGLLVGIEWLPFTNIATAADAAAIVRGADRANGGYCIDIWHHVRGANDLSLVTDLEPEKVFALQMCDGPAEQVLDDYKADCLASRVVPGAGTFDVAAFVRVLTDMGVTAPISLEICSTEMWEGPVDDAARHAADAMRVVLAEVGA